MTQQSEVRVQGLGSQAPAHVNKVFVSVGQTVARDAKLLIVATDKVNLDVCAPAAGRVTELLVALNATVHEGDLLLVLERSDPEPPQPSPTPTSIPVRAADPSTGDGTSLDFHASPWIRGLARERALDLSQVVGTGPHGRILQSDLERPPTVSLELPSSRNSGVQARNDGSGSLDSATQSRPLSRLQSAVGRNLSQNWAQIPHVTQFDETDITELEAFRVALNLERRQQGPKLNLLPFIVKATACALAAFPEFNSSLVAENLLLKQSIHLGFAVDTPEGLLVPVIQHADRLPLLQIAREIARLAEGARDSKLLPRDLQGGSFTISNLGGVGGTAFTPIINAPEVAILGVSKAELKPKWNGSAFVPRLMLPLSLSYDHRVINGVAGARFVAHLGSVLSDLRRTLL